MKRLRSKRVCGIFALAATAGMLSSCGSSKKSDDTATPGLVTGVDGAVVTASDAELVIASKLALIPPKDGSAGLRLAETFDDDKTNVFVEERSMEALAQAESILCFINQTRFETQVNKGAYVAVVNESLCENKEKDQNGGQSLMNMKVIATREANAPLNAVGWIEEEDDGEKHFIHWRLVIAEGSSATNPLGIFRFNWAFKNAAGEQMGGGLIESYRSSASGLGLRFYSSDGNSEEGGYTAANAEMTLGADGAINGGKATTAQVWEGSEWSFNSQYKIDFNDSYLYKSGTETSGNSGNEETESGDACVDRGAYNSVVYRYGLYNDDGSRKNLNSGFPIEFEVDGETRHGHASYWGLWTEGEVALDNGAEVNRVDWSSGDKVTTPYTVIHAPGKLIKYTKKTLKLSELANTDLRMWEYNEQTQESATYIVHWNGSQFVKIAKEVQNQDGPPSYEEASGAVTAPEWGFNFWAESLNANIGIPKTATLSNDLELSYHSQETVSGSEAANLTLSCYSRCPKVDGSGGYDNENEWEIRLNTATPISYTFNASDKNLYSGSTAFSAPSSQDNWIESGALVTSAQLGNLGSQNISPWELQGQLDSFYKWQSSANPWGQYYSVKDANGAIVTFDKPLEFKYVHSQASDYDGKAENDGYGKTFRLNYGGFGDLWGIPWENVEGSSESKPIFSLKTGTVLTDDAGSSYRVKAIDVAQMLTVVDAGLCTGAGLDPAGAPALPGSDVIEAVDIGDQPGDDIAIKVIEGELVQ